MSSEARKLPRGDYKVGYGRPPLHRRFAKGRSGNPRGRPRGSSKARLMHLVLAEAYRTITVREGSKVIRMPAIRAVLRSQLASAAKGNGPAQRAFLDTVQAIEQRGGAAPEQNADNTPPMSDLEVARRIAFALEKGRLALEEKDGA